MKKLVCFGDSITQGTIGDAYVRHIAAQMQHLEVINAGIDGDTTYNLFQRLDTAVLQHNPDAVLIMVGLNDFGTAYGELLSRLYYRRLKKVPIAIDIPVEFGIGDITSDNAHQIGEMERHTVQRAATWAKFVAQDRHGGLRGGGAKVAGRDQWPGR
jgi:lysophospholipase L1-like esterase